MHRHITLWKVCAQKYLCSRAEWSKLPCKTQPAERVAEIQLSSDVSVILFTSDWPNWKPTESLTGHIYSNQEERHRDKMAAHSNNLQTVTDGIGRRVTSSRQYTSLILVNHRAKVNEAHCHNVMLKQQLCSPYARHQMSSFKLGSNIVMKQWSKIPPHLNNVAASPCDILSITKLTQVFRHWHFTR